MTVRPSQIKKYEIEYIESLRENVKNAYRYSKGEELHDTNYKANPYYVDLIEDIKKYTGKKVCEGTIVKFFYHDEKRCYRKSTIDIFEEYTNKINTTSLLLKSVNKPESHFNEVKNKYYNYLNIICGKIYFEGTSKEIPIEDVFVSIPLTKFDYKKDIGYVYAEKQELNKFFAKEKLLLIIANPGSGKSTLIKSIAISFAFPQKGKKMYDCNIEEPIFPIYIRCRDINEISNLSILNIIKTQFYKTETYNQDILDEESFNKQFEILVLKSIDEGTLLLLIDGLDEIGSEAIKLNLIDQLEVFLKTYPNVKVIITSRFSGVHQLINSSSIINKFNYFQLSFLSFKKIKELTFNWYKLIVGNSNEIIKEADLILEEILTNSKIYIFARNPLLLTAILLIKRKIGYIPEDKITLYNETIKMLIEKWNIRGHYHEELDYKETLIQLSYIAFWMTINKKQTINDDELEICFQESKDLINRKIDYTFSSFIKRVENRSGLLKISSNSKYEFVHLSFQEHLTAIAIAKRYLPKEILISNKNFIKSILNNDHYWKEIIITSIKLSKDFFKEIIIPLKIEFNCIDFQIKTYYWEIYLLKYNRINNNIPNFFENNIQSVTKYKLIKWYLHFIEYGVEMGEFQGLILDNLLRHSIFSCNNIILNSKFNNEYKDKVKYNFFNKFEDKYMFEYTTALIDIYNFELSKAEPDLENLLNVITSEITRNDKESKCNGILKLMTTYTLTLLKKDFNKNNLKTKVKLNNIYNLIITTTSFNDEQYYFIIAKSIGILTNFIQIEINSEYVKIYIDGWFKYLNNLHLISAFALYRILRKKHIRFNISQMFPQIKEKIQYLNKNPQNEYDKYIAVLLGFLINENIDKNFNSLKEIYFKRYVNLNIPNLHYNDFRGLGISPAR